MACCSPMPPPMLSLMGASSLELLKLNGGFGPVAIMLVTCSKHSLHHCPAAIGSTVLSQ